MSYFFVVVQEVHASGSYLYHLSHIFLNVDTRMISYFKSAKNNMINRMVTPYFLYRYRL